jgi:hypothetical protein
MAEMLPAGAARYMSEAAEIRPGSKTVVLVRRSGNVQPSDLDDATSRTDFAYTRSSACR